MLISWHFVRWSAIQFSAHSGHLARADSISCLHVIQLGTLDKNSGQSAAQAFLPHAHKASSPPPFNSQTNQAEPDKGRTPFRAESLALGRAPHTWGQTHSTHSRHTISSRRTISLTTDRLAESPRGHSAANASRGRLPSSRPLSAIILSSAACSKPRCIWLGYSIVCLGYAVRSPCSLAEILLHHCVFGITCNTLVRSSQSSSGPAGGASDGYGLGRGRRCTTTAAGALRVIV